MKYIDLIVGARPNFVKLASLTNKKIRKNHSKKFKFRIIHTGQHYDKNMSEVFFKNLNIPKPDINLNVGSGSHAFQTAEIMKKYENVLKKSLSNICIVFGDVNSTLACALVAKKLNIRVAHVESGIRSFDNSMPEEINRIITDSISDYHFITSIIAKKNLLNSGVRKENIYFVGNTMIDTLINNSHNLKKHNKLFTKLKLNKKKYIITTIHRPDNLTALFIESFLKQLIEITNGLSIVFPLHPRTSKLIKKSEHYKIFKNRITFISPASYIDFNFLLKNSLFVITDSGGITEETTYYNIPTLTLRNNTERPETIKYGTNVLIGKNFERLQYYTKKILKKKWKQSKPIKYWDGKVGERIIKILEKIC